MIFNCPSKMWQARFVSKVANARTRKPLVEAAHVQLAQTVPAAAVSGSVILSYVKVATLGKLLLVFLYC
jgi:hypothetical protein